MKRWLKAAFPGIERKIYRLIWRMTPDGISEVEIRKGVLKGRRFSCSMKRERDYWLGQWEPEIEKFLVEEIKEGYVVYDIGVHKGYFCLVAASVSGPTGRVVGFEPNPGNRQAAIHNITLNSDLASRITITPYAVSDRIGSETFQGGPDSTVGGIVRIENGGSTYEVPSITLDEFVRNGGALPDLIKMDIEGGEEWAIQGMGAVLSTARCIVLIEVHGPRAFASVQMKCDLCGYSLLPLSTAAGRFEWPRHFVARSLSPE